MVPVQGPRLRTPPLRAPRVEDVPAAKRALEDLAARRDDWRGAVRIEATGMARLQQIAKGILVFKMLMGAFTAISLSSAESASRTCCWCRCSSGQERSASARP